MKNIIKYALILAIASSGVAFAQTAVLASGAEAPKVAASDKLSVKAAVKDGVVRVTVSGKVDLKTTSAEDALKDAIGATLKAVGIRSNLARAIESVMSAIKNHLTDRNYPAAGDIALTVVVTPNADTGIIDTKVDLSIAGEKYESTAKSTFSTDGSVSTTGNITKTDEQGNKSTSGMLVNIAPNGDMTTIGEKGTVQSKTAAAEAAEAVVNPDAVQNDIGGGSKADSESTILPDNSIITTAER